LVFYRLPDEFIILIKNKLYSKNNMGGCMNNKKTTLISSALTTALLSLSFSFNVSASERVYGEWSTPENLGSTLNTEARDGCQTLSRDGLSLYFASDRDTGSDMDLYVAERNSVDEPFGTAQSLGDLNAAGADDVCPSLSYDGHVLFFATARSGGCGKRDLWMARRHDAKDNLGWDAPVHLGCVVNSDNVDQGPSYYEGEGDQKYIFFSSNRQSGDPEFAGHDIYSMKLFTDGTPDESTVKLVRELSSLAHDHRPHVSKNGKEVFFDSNRNGPATGLDVWTATREDTSVPFSPPEPVSNVSSDKNDVRAVMNWKGTEMYITSNRSGGVGRVDIYKSTRTKIKQDD
jgi:Tol biopolymer transport system component